MATSTIISAFDGSLAAGLIEAFVTPSGLPTAIRVGIGVSALAGFLLYVGLLGSRAERRGLDADLDEELATRVPVSA